MTILFLDDMPERVPMIRRKEEVAYARDANEFVEWLKLNGVPDCISFDHDLSEEHYGPTGGYMNPNRPATGTDCARWAVENGFIPKTVIVHSWNKEGAMRIANCFMKDGKLIYPCEDLIVRPFNPKLPHMWRTE